MESKFRQTKCVSLKDLENCCSCILCRLPAFLLVYETLEGFQSSSEQNKGDASPSNRTLKIKGKKQTEEKEGRKERWILRVTCRKYPWELITTSHLISANSRKYHNTLLLWDNSESLRVIRWHLLESSQLCTQANPLCVPVLPHHIGCEPQQCCLSVWMRVC